METSLDAPNSTSKETSTSPSTFASSATSQLPRRNDVPWMDAFFQNCHQDPTKTAMDLVAACPNDNDRFIKLEALAHRVLQELFIRENTAKLAVPMNYGNFQGLPYQENYNAEDGEKAYQIWKKLMIPDVTANTVGKPPLLHASRTARTCFGCPYLADTIIRANSRIEASGAVFNSQWIQEYQHDLGDRNCILLFLNSRLFHEANTETLEEIVKELELSKTLFQILDDWNLQSEYSDMLPPPKGRALKWDDSRSCYLCLIFIARAYKLTSALQWTDIRESFSFKVLNCLDILQRNYSPSDQVELSIDPAVTPSPSPPSSVSLTQNDFSMERMTKEKNFAAPPRVMANSVWKEDESLSLDSESKDSEYSDSPISHRAENQISVNVNDDSFCWVRPVEKLCIRSGTVLQRYPTVCDAQQSVSDTQYSEAFKSVLQGRYLRGSRYYKGFFWRFEGTNHVPHQGITDADDIRRQPVEQLCLKTGNVLRRFATANEAQRSVTNSKNIANFSRVLEGKYLNGVYKGYFWRLVGTDRLPDQNNAVPDQNNAVPDQKKDVSVQRIDGKVNIRYQPVEQLCLKTGSVLRRFSTAEEAQRSVTDSTSFFNFKMVLEGKYQNSRAYKGFFWRLAGTDYVPENSSTKKRKEHPLHDDEEKHPSDNDIGKRPNGESLMLHPKRPAPNSESKA